MTTARQEVWAAVLAAGDGLRLAELTTNARAAPHCGWCDLGTPGRVAALLRRLQEESAQLTAWDCAPADVHSLKPFIHCAAQAAHLGP